MNDLIIKQGKLINDQIVDILVRDSKIIAIGPDAAKEQQATKTINLKGQLYISAGWIDAHTRCYPESPIYFDDPDLAGTSCGVTTLVDVGSVGADDIEHFFAITREVTKAMQKKSGLPLMVHIGNNPPNLDDITDLLTKAILSPTILQRIGNLPGH